MMPPTLLLRCESIFAGTNQPWQERMHYNGRMKWFSLSEHWPVDMVGGRVGMDPTRRFALSIMQSQDCFDRTQLLYRI